MDPPASPPLVGENISGEAASEDAGVSCRSVRHHTPYSVSIMRRNKKCMFVLILEVISRNQDIIAS